MPFYQITNQAGSLDAAQRAEIAAGITDIHLDLAGGLRQFVNVVFQEYPAGLGFNGGTQGAPVLIGGSIRAGREQAVKTAMMEAISALVIRVGHVSPKDLTVSIADVKASNAMEGGHILPEPGEEAAWLAKVGPLLGLTN
ncbi:tautomerase family protein [Sphingomonas sp. GlSt437]|uniref:tautomerase family protein n=1 Tax=Sphingomonas sp. GlSt437 TaxID=3389970 RepID=UPI003A838795